MPNADLPMPLAMLSTAKQAQHVKSFRKFFPAMCPASFRWQSASAASNGTPMTDISSVSNRL